MRADQRIVTQIPVRQLWDSREVLPLRRMSQIGEAEIAELLRTRRVQFVIADVGSPLVWVPSGQLFDAWKDEVKARLVPATAPSIDYETYPGGYAYVATEWRSDADFAVVLFEKYH